jgi:hypothetical protein
VGGAAGGPLAMLLVAGHHLPRFVLRSNQTENVVYVIDLPRL